MYSTSILSTVANKLQTLMGKRKLILTLGVIAVGIQSAMAASQTARSASAPGRTPPASTRQTSESIFSQHLDQQVGKVPETGPADPAHEPAPQGRSRADRGIPAPPVEEAHTPRPEEQIMKRQAIQQKIDRKERITEEECKLYLKNDPEWTEQDNGKWVKKGGEAPLSLQQVCDEKKIKKENWRHNTPFEKTKVQVGLATAGAAMMTGGFVATGIALDTVSPENIKVEGMEGGHKNILTSLGKEDGGNVLAYFIGFLVAGGFALIVFSLLTFALKDRNQRNMNLFQSMMTTLAFIAGSSLMLGINFMEQNAPDASTAFGNAFIFKGEVVGEQTVEGFADGTLSSGEIGAGFALWGFIVAVILMGIVGAFFFLEKKCFAKRF